MAIYYISPNGNDSTGNGSNGNPWKTIGKANNSIAAGDTVILKNGTYSAVVNGAFQTINITKANTTWRAESKWGAVIDGGWGPELLNLSGTNFGPAVYDAWNKRTPGSNQNGVLLYIKNSGITLDGLVVCNSPCRGIQIAQSPSEAGQPRSNNTIINCLVDWIFETALMIIPQPRIGFTNIDNNVVDNCVFSRASVKTRASWSGYFGGSWPRAITAGGSNCVIKNSVFAYTFGEIGAEYSTPGVTFDRNVMILCNYGHYIDCNVDSIISNNIIAVPDSNQSSLGWVHSGQNAPNIGANGIRSEREHDRASAGVPQSFRNDGGSIYNNVLINTSIDFTGKASDSGAHYGVSNTYIGHNTIVVREGVKDGHALRIVNFIANASQSFNGIIENNIVSTERTPPGNYGGVMVAGNGIQATFRNNVFPPETPASMRGTNSILVRNTGLLNPAATFTWTHPFFNESRSSVIPKVQTAVDYIKDWVSTNLQPTPQSPAIGAGASSMETVNGTTVRIAARQFDYAGFKRANPPSIGAVEFGGSAPTNSITANFTISDETPEPGVAITFTDTSSKTGSATIDSWSWEIDNRVVATTAKLTYTFEKAGVYSISLTVRDSARSLSSTKTINLTVSGDYRLSATFTQKDVNGNNTSGGQAPFTVIFEAIPDLSGGAQITKYEWDSGDGVFRPGPSTYDYSYTTIGTFTPRLRLTDNTANKTATITGSAITITNVIIPGLTTYYVDGQSGADSGDGSANRPWKTLSKATSTIKPGDQVRIRTATYREEVTIRTPRTTWIADTGHKPVIDGNYHPGLLTNGSMPNPSQPGNNYLPKDNENGNLVTILAEGVVLDGLTVQNTAGSGLAIGSVGTNSIIRNCRVDFAYQNGIKVEPSSSSNNNLIENCVVTRSSVRVLAGKPVGAAGIVTRNTRDCTIRNNIVAYCWGRGIQTLSGSIRTIVEGNIVHSCHVFHLYNDHGIDTVYRNNLIYHTQHPNFLLASGGIAGGIVFNDEDPQNTSRPFSSGGQVYNNIVIGMGVLLAIGNGQTGNTQLNGAYIGYNTFIGGSKTTLGVQLDGNTWNRPHKNSLIENNLIYNVSSNQVTGDLSGITFRHNLWDSQPPALIRGPGDRIGNPNLTNPNAPITGNQVPDPTTNIDPANYRLSDRSTLAIGMASDGSVLNGLTPPSIRKDFFGSARDVNPDIGAHEFSGVIVDITANFSIGPNQVAGIVPHTVDFTDKSVSSRPIISWAWDFGDGESSTETNPSHTYVKQGNFDVSLTVTNDQGKSDKIIQTALITVNRSTTTVVPNSFRRFVLREVKDQHILVFGTQYPDLHCVAIWNDEQFQMSNYLNIYDFEFDNVEDGKTEVTWLDQGDGSALFP